jgi:hypothetical protein
MWFTIGYQDGQEETEGVVSILDHIYHAWLRRSLQDGGYKSFMCFLIRLCTLFLDRMLLLVPK